MFQTDLIIYLQSFSSPFLDAFFRFITSLGDESFIQALVIVLIFGIDFRRGFLLLQLIMVNALATGMLKQFFALPRPFNVDGAVKVPGADYGGPDVVSDAGGADRFWGPLPETAVAHFRTHLPNSFGFPSGHTSSAAAIWGGLAALFKKSWLTAVCTLLILLIPFSRLYLGRHFPADVLGGYVLGGILLLGFHRLFFSAGRVSETLFGTGADVSENRWIARLLLLFGFAAPLLLVAFGIEAKWAAMWIGINAGFLLIRQSGIPDSAAPLPKRIGRVAVAAGLFYLLDAAAAPLIQESETAGAGGLQYPIIVIMIALFLWLTTEASVKLGWMKRNPEPER